MRQQSKAKFFWLLFGRQRSIKAKFGFGFGFDFDLIKYTLHASCQLEMETVRFFVQYSIQTDKQ